MGSIRVSYGNRWSHVDLDAAFNVGTGSAQARNIIGSFAEACILRGCPDLVHWGDTATMRVPHGTWELYPDLHDGRGRVVEVKAGWRRFYVHAAQMHAYAEATRGAQVPYIHPRVEYAFLHYKLPQNAGSYATGRALLAALVQEVRWALLLPLDATQRVAEARGLRSGAWAKRFGTDGWCAYYPLTPQALTPYTTPSHELPVGLLRTTQTVSGETPVGPLRPFPLWVIASGEPKVGAHPTMTTVPLFGSRVATDAIKGCFFMEHNVESF